MSLNSFSMQFIVKSEKMDKNGLVPIYAKLFINTQKIEISTNRRIELYKWDKKNKKAKEDEELNQFLELYKTKLYNTYSKALLKDEY